MKKNRLLIALLVFLSVLSSLGAKTLDEIVKAAEEASPSYQNVLLTYQNGLLNISTLEEDDIVGVEVSTVVNPLSDVYSDGSTNASSLTDESSRGITVSPSLSVTLPNNGKTKITGGSSITSRYSDGKTSVSGNVGVSHTFDFTGYDENHADELNYASTKYNTEMTYKKSELTFRKSVINTISSIISLENSIQQSRYDKDKQQKAVDKIKALGTYSETSATYIYALNLLESYSSSLEALEEQHEDLLSTYKTLTGLEWDGIDALEAPTLSLTTYENGNTSVLIESLSAESSEETYLKTLSTVNPSSLSTSLDAVISSSSDVTLSGEAKYTSGNWNVSVTPGLTISSSGSTRPNVTVSGTWHNDTTASRNTVNTALNNAQMAQNDYLEALSSYNEEATSYALKILQWNSSREQKEAELKYKKTLLDNEQTLYELGLATSDSLEKAKMDYEISQREWHKVILEGLSLECDLKIFAL